MIHRIKMGLKEGDFMEEMDIFAFSIATGAVAVAIFASDKVRKLEKRVKEIEEKLRDK